MGGSERRGMGEWAGASSVRQQRGGVGARCPYVKAAALEKASGGRWRGGCARSGHMLVAVRKENVTVFFEKPHRTEGRAEETCRPRLLGRLGNEPS
jgi:hypothetical protein